MVSQTIYKKKKKKLAHFINKAQKIVCITFDFKSNLRKTSYYPKLFIKKIFFILEKYV